MTLLSEILDYNGAFVQEKKYEQYETTKFPDKKMVILTCMDTRLMELLPKAMNLGNGDAKIIKNAGAVLSHPFGSIMRSILVAVYELQAGEVCVVGHHDCGMVGLNSFQLLEKSKERGIQEKTIQTLRDAEIDLSEWLQGFDSVENSVLNSVKKIRQHPLFARNIPVHGLIIHPETGKLEVVADGYEQSP